MAQVIPRRESSTAELVQFVRQKYVKAIDQYCIVNNALGAVGKSIESRILRPCLGAESLVPCNIHEVAIGH
jgi:hypothetical protein